MRPRQTSKGPKPRSKKQLYTLCTSLVVFFLLSAIGLLTSIPTALAMEQQARCGLEEHVHVDDCYLNNIIICQQKAHTHSDSCYLLLLEDNDINMLLTEVSKTEDKNLETLIAGVLGEAVRLNELGEEEPEVEEEGMFSFLNNTRTASDEPIMATSFSGTTYAGTEVSQLNETIETFGVEPAVVLNEGMAVPVTMTLDEENDNSVSMLSLNEDGSVTVPDVNQAGGNTQANTYIKVDDKWILIDSGTFVSKTSNGTAYRSINKDTYTSVITAAVGLENDEYTLKYASSADGSPTDTVQTISVYESRQWRSYFTFGRYSKNPIYIYLYDENGANPIQYYTVTYDYGDGTTVEKYVRADTSITHPTGYTWLDAANNEVGTSTQITQATTFHVSSGSGTVTPDPDVDSLTVNYNVNFGTSYNNLTIATSDRPSVLGTTSVNVEKGNDILIQDVTNRNVDGVFGGNIANDRYGVVHFLGWQITKNDGTKIMIQPTSALSWEELEDYAVDGRVTLTGQWDFHMHRSANFFIKYDSKMFDENGNHISGTADAYTQVIFQTYVGGVPTNSNRDTLNNTYKIAATEDNTTEADRQIRALHGESSTGVWLAEFPTDAYIFEQLKPYATNGQLTVGENGEKVNVNDLNENEYTIRWTLFNVGSDSKTVETWHVDGMLVRKTGAFEITKTFAGNPTLIEGAKNGFKITASNGTTTQTFRLDNAISVENGVYRWKVEDVKYNEVWTITESPPVLSNALSYYEWTVVDPYNTQNEAGIGKEVQIRGVTYPVDVQSANLMQVNFNNIYYQKDSLMLKKEDEKTGRALSGAEFELWQNGSRMTFDYIPATGLYEYNQEGAGDTSVLSSDTSNGYINISTTGFSYESGPITVKEVKAPVGYGEITDVELGKQSDGSIGIFAGSSDYVKYKDGLLIIQNSSDPVDITVKKEWKNYVNTDKLPVVVQLLANGDNALAADLIGINGTASVTLNAVNEYTHTWYGLPVYANGEAINWSVREIQVGDEKCKADYTFANWIPSISKTTSKDAENQDIVMLTVTNIPKGNVILILTKTDWEGVTFLPGAEFTLKNMNTGITTTLTTDGAGKLTFQNLKYETRYMLTEVKAPDGYWAMSEPVYLTIGGDGTVMFTDADGKTQNVDYEYVDINGKYSIQVKNRTSQPMPNTGGNGTLLFTGLGMLMLFSVFTYQKKNTKRKRRRGARRTSR